MQRLDHQSDVHDHRMEEHTSDHRSEGISSDPTRNPKGMSRDEKCRGKMTDCQACQSIILSYQIHLLPQAG